MNTSLRSISNHNNIPKIWVKVLKDSCSALLWSLLPTQLQSDVRALIQQRNGLNLRDVSSKNFNLTALLQFLVQTGREVAAEALTKIKVFIQTRKVNGRLIAGIFLAGCFAPLSDIFYTFDLLTYFESFRLETRIKDYYYSNYRYLFMCLGPYMAWMFAGLGAYFIFIPETAKKKWLVSICLAYPSIKILWLLQVGSHAEFHAVPSYAYWIYGSVLSVCLWLAAEYLVYLFNHKILNALSTLENITNNRKALPAEQVNEMYATTYAKLKSLI